MSKIIRPSKLMVADPKVEGIGTEATRADIINTLIKRRYAERKGKQFYATDKGVEFISIFPIHELMSPEFTAKMEMGLSDIANGSGNYNGFIEQTEHQTVQRCHEIATDTGKTMSVISTAGTGSSAAEKIDMKCPVCGGEIVEYKWGWSCSGYKDGCHFSVGNTICQKHITEAILDRMVKTGSSGVIHDFVAKSGKKFDAELKINTDLWTTDAG